MTITCMEATRGNAINYAERHTKLPGDLACWGSPHCWERSNEKIHLKTGPTAGVTLFRVGAALCVINRWMSLERKLLWTAAGKK